LAEIHSGEIRYQAPAKQWIAWNGEEWLADEQHLALRFAREICREAADAYGEPAIDSHRSAAGVVALAKCDPRLVVTGWPCHPDIEAAVDGWIADHCEIDPEAWTARAELLASFVGFERFDRDELSIALAARGIMRQRRRNIHGFCGIRLREGGDVDA
jgi:hypothetical protein